ncbi:MAG TPA: DNA translocase FtsK 4TM domain-containing protein [Candidatus Paceibacterota bacterium]
MSRRDGEEPNKKTGRPPAYWLPAETKHAIIAIGAFVLGLFFLLASLGYAGRAGAWLYDFLTLIFGWGFFLCPIILFLIGRALLKADRPKILGLKLIASGIFLIGGLGLLSLLAGPLAGGWVGQILTKPLVVLFDRYISLIFFTGLAVIAIIIMFDSQITLEWTLFGRAFNLAGWRRKNKNEAIAAAALVEQSAEPKISEDKPPASNVGKTDDELNIKTLGVLGTPSVWPKLREKFESPPLALLEHDTGKPVAGDIKANANIIKRTLANFGIVVEMDEVSIGPSITRYALKPAEGVKLSRIIGLQNDLALALAAHPIRIEAPIPGLSLVGLEIPNRTRATVGLASLVGSTAFTNSPLPLYVTLGRDIAGTPHFANLARAPHILIAGATGSGKSVVIHTFITSLLYRNPPANLRFIMIDPKRVELTPYNKIPHLLTPVITNAKKAIYTLKWAIQEMERRYGVLEEEQVRDIQSFHQSHLASPAGAAETMPYIVIVIDELADIMSAYPRELEAAVVRLAQMSRAVGIHLVLSTQRPSVEVITGLIKVNIPSRVALQVASQIDSRTILDMAGAEKLLGAGDMLYLSGERSKPLRLQSAFISETEVKRLVDWLAKKYGAGAAEELPLVDLARKDSLTPEFAGANADDDELYEAAKEIVTSTGKASASFLQRRLKIGYARAARLLDLLEEAGIIGPGEGAKPRQVYEQPPPSMPSI